MLQIKDRLPDLKKKIEIHNSSDDIRSYEVLEEDDILDSNYNPYNGPIGNLLKRYLYINERLNEIENHMQKMKSMTTAENINNFDQKDFNKIRAESIKIGNDVIKKFKKLESKLPNKDEDHSALGRMKRLLYFGFFQRYIIIWTKNENFLLDFEQKLRKKLKLQSQILNSNLSDEDLETMIENKNTSLFTSNILQEAEVERKIVQEMQDRFEDLKKLEKSISEVHNLFINLQNLVVEQGNTIQCIETHFDATRDYVEQAKKHIEIVEQIKKQGCCSFRCFF